MLKEYFKKEEHLNDYNVNVEVFNKNNSFNIGDKIFIKLDKYNVIYKNNKNQKINYRKRWWAKKAQSYLIKTTINKFKRVRFCALIN